MIPLSFLHVNYYTLLFFVVIDHTTSHFCLRRYPRCSLLIIDVHHTSPEHNLECQAANVRPCYLGLSAMCSLDYWIVEPTRGFHYDGRGPGMEVDAAQVVRILELTVLANGKRGKRGKG